MLQIPLSICPPAVHPGRQAWPRLADRGPGDVPDRPLLARGPPCAGRPRRLQVACPLGRGLGSRVRPAAGLPRARAGRHEAPRARGRRGPPAPRGGPRHPHQRGPWSSRRRVGRRLPSGERRLRWLAGLLRGAPVSPKSERRALAARRHARQAIRPAQTPHPLCRERDHGVGAVPDPLPHARAQARASRRHHRLPRRRGAIVCTLCQPQRAGSEGPADQAQTCPKWFLHGPHALASRPTRRSRLLPGRRRRQPRGLPRRPHPTSGCGRTAPRGLAGHTRDHRPHRVPPHPARQPAGRERGAHQTRQPLPAGCGVPEPRGRRAGAARQGLGETRPAAFGQASLRRKAAYALGGVRPKTVAKLSTVCFRRARVNLDFPWPTVIRMQTTR